MASYFVLFQGSNRTNRSPNRPSSAQEIQDKPSELQMATLWRLLRLVQEKLFHHMVKKLMFLSTHFHGIGLLSKRKQNIKTRRENKVINCIKA